MDPFLFQKLTANEVQRYSSELDYVLEAHSRWLTTLTHVLVCRTEPDPADLAEDAHLRCNFGRWCAGIDNPELLQHAQFAVIVDAHVELHRIAREVLLRLNPGEPITCDSFNALTEASETLRTQVHHLRSELKKNLNLISKLTGKVFENASEGVIITDPQGRIISINKAFTEVTGYSLDQVVGRNPNLLYSGRQSQSFYEEMWEALINSGQWEGEIWNRRKDGSVYPETLSIAAVKDDAGTTTHYVGIFSDITTAKENEERLYQLAHFDTVTALPNRMTFYDRLSQALARSRRNGHELAVMFLDLDGFKTINDNLGHSAGDELLRQVGNRLLGCLRESDTVSRFGGDEFTVVLAALKTHEGAMEVARKIIDRIAEPFVLDGERCHITTSVGISFFPQDGDEAEQLIVAADTAMYAAKKAGKNRYQVFEATHSA